MTVTGILPSYLYEEYNDDDDLQGFVAAQNSLQQGYLDWFNDTPLADYTYETVTARLLDWVGEGLYGISRPVLSFGAPRSQGPLNTWILNFQPLNVDNATETVFGTIGSFAIGISPIESATIGGALEFATDDDIYKRVITWNFFKGDGTTFNIRWLKRRIERFLNGANGIDPGINQTYDVRIIFGSFKLVNIILLGGTVTFTNRAVLNEMMLNATTLNGATPTYSTNRGKYLKPAIESGVLQMPFQYRYQIFG